MPMQATSKRPAKEVRPGDLFGPNQVEVVERRLGTKHLTLLGQNTTRLYYGSPDDQVLVTRTVPTLQERLDEANEHLEHVLEQLRETIAHARSFDLVEALREVCTNRQGQYTSWLDSFRVASLLERAARARRLAELGQVLSYHRNHATEPLTPLQEAEVVLQWQDELKEELLRWSPPRSSSAISNAMDVIDFEVRQELAGVRSFFGNVQLRYAVERVHRVLTDMFLKSVSEPLPRTAEPTVPS